MSKIRKFIEDKLVEMHKTTTVDQYGQIHKSNFSVNALFGDRWPEVAEYLYLDTMFTVSTYGNRNYSYKAICQIIDPVVSEMCRKAKEENPNYQNAMTGW
jgi:hypothetical protein